MSSSSVTAPLLNLDTLPSHNEFAFVDHNLASILRNLDQLGFDIATNESLERFVPTSDTKKAILSRTIGQTTGCSIGPFNLGTEFMGMTF
jgi:hypothetical protein